MLHLLADKIIRKYSAQITWKNVLTKDDSGIILKINSDMTSMTPRKYLRKSIIHKKNSNIT
jgi:hypothetical protein